MGKAILVGGQKGGTGKSTISINLALMAKDMGHDVLLVDTDQQATASNFISYRNERGFASTPPCIHLHGPKVNKEIDNLAGKYELLIIDAGGQDSVELRSAMVSSAVSAFYTPIQPSAFDLDTLNHLEELVTLSQVYNSHLQATVVFNQCPTHSMVVVEDEARELLSHYDVFSVCPTKLCRRIAFQYAAASLQSLVEFQADKIRAMPRYQSLGYSLKASHEIIRVYNHVLMEQYTYINFENMIREKSD